jgi:glycosyltransferase involved in cell wall biosynthesis
MAQTRPADEIVVVDDGSTDDPAVVVGRYPKARLLRQENAGLAAARNFGLASISTDYVVFLDADDLLCPAAISRNLTLFADNPDAGFVYGAYELVDADRHPLQGPWYMPIGGDPLATLLRCNAIGMHGTVLYSSGKLREAGGFDPALRSCEDYDVYLKMAKRFSIASDDSVIALYRTHENNMSADPVRMLKMALAVHARHRPSSAQRFYLEHWKAGCRDWRRFYADVAIGGRWGADRGSRYVPMLRMLRHAPRRMIQRAVMAALRKGRAGFSKNRRPLRP